MESGRFDVPWRSSDEEEDIFLGFSLEEVAEIRRRERQRRLRDVDREFEEIFEFGAHEGGTNSDVEILVSEEEEENEEEASHIKAKTKKSFNDQKFAKNLTRRPP